MAQSQSCNEGLCPVDCNIGAWSTWSECTKTCGEGSQERTRTELPGNPDTKVCPNLGEVRKCSEQSCAVTVPCNFSAWGEPTACSATCGGGYYTRTRVVSTHPGSGGTPCPALEESVACNTVPCAVDCQVTTWTRWSVCSRTCASMFLSDGSKTMGHQTRMRFVNVAADAGGKACPLTSEERHCNTHICPQDCKMSNYTEFSACSKTCGTSERFRHRTIEQLSARGGRSCPATADSEACNNYANAHLCPRDCQMSAWSEFGNCSASCGGGTQHAARTAWAQPLRGGAPCSPFLVKSQDCNTQSCTATACVVSNWTSWSACTTQCGGGQHVRTRVVTTMPSTDGGSCPELSEALPCNTQGCGCTHVRCTYAKHRSGHWRIRVSHSAMEAAGRRHKCAFDYATNKCVCKCWYAEHYITDDPANVPTTIKNWKNLVFHEHTTGAAHSDTPAFKLVNYAAGESKESIGYTNGVETAALYWNTRNSNNHRL